MSNKQTAVEWYANRLCDIEIAYNQGLIDTEVYIESKTHAYDQAKEMEKEEIINAHIDGQPLYYTGQSAKSEKYYNETYGGDK